MAYIGNTVQSIPFITDIFSGTGAQTSFTLTRAPAGTAAIAVFIAGLYQPPGNYTLSGVTLNFSAAPAAGTSNIVVLHLGNGSTTQVPSDGSVTLARLANDTYAYINAAFATANSDTSTSNSAAAYANSAFLAANNSVGTNLTQNTNITSAASYANAAFAQANTDFTNITTTAAVYGNSSSIPTITLSANGRISSITNTAVSIPSASYVTGSNNSILTTNTSITGNVTIAPNTGGLTIGPVVISANQTVTVSANARWVVL